MTAAAEPVVVVGLGCRFPGGAESPEQLWQVLAEGRDATGPIAAGRWVSDGRLHPDPGAPGAAPILGGFLTDVAGWDAGLFGVSPQEARRIDPQHRLVMDVAWRALEDAAIDLSDVRGSRTGVFVGVSDAQQYVRLQHQCDPGCVDDPMLPLGSAATMAAGRLAFFLDSTGPALVVDTACSTSLVAIHLARQSLARHECDLAIVAVASALLHPESYLAAYQIGMLAPDGRCKTYDRAADGFAMGEGAGAVVLERLGDARSHGRRIRAATVGSAVNQDGRTNGITAPSRSAQASVIRAAIADAGCEPDQLSFVEGHGSGTALGDAIELQALSEVFGRARQPALLVGAVKSNLGHLLAAAGMAGFFKSVLALENRSFPANANLTAPNPILRRMPGLHPRPDAATLDGTGPLMGGVSAFGWSGTNAHVVLAAVEPEPRPLTDGTLEVLTLSAATPAALDGLGEAIGALLADPAMAVGDVAATLHAGRRGHACRRAVVGSDRGDLIERCSARGSMPPAPKPPRLAVVLPEAGLGLARVRRLAGCSPLLPELVRRGEDGGGGVDDGPSATASDALVELLVVAGLRPDVLVGPVGTSGRAGGVDLVPRPVDAHGWRAITDAVDVVATFDPPGSSGPSPSGARPLIAMADADGTPAAFLDGVGRLWELGLDVRWPVLVGRRGQVVTLPPHPFDRVRYWPQHAPAAAVSPAAKRAHCYTASWRTLPPAPGGDDLSSSTVIVMGAGSPFEASLVIALTQRGALVAGLEPTDVEGTARTLDDLYGDGTRASLQVVDCVGVGRDDDDPLAAAEVLARHRILNQALTKSRFATASRFVGVVSGTCSVVGGDTSFSAAGGALVGMARTLVSEYHGLRCRVVDVEPADAARIAVEPRWAALLAENVALELVALGSATPPPATEPDNGDIVAWRSGRRWGRELEPVTVPVDAPSPWDPNRSYVITGGTRGLGLGLAKRLAAAGVRKLLLAGRTELPARERWEEVAAGRDPATSHVRATIGGLLELEALGATVVTSAIDVSQPGAVARLLAVARRDLGGATAFVHCAGIPGGGLLERTTADDVRPVIATKVRVLPELAEAVAASELDQVILYSSAVTALGGLGETSYAAANAALESFADALADRCAEARVLAVAWGPWEHDDWGLADPDAAWLAAEAAAYRDAYGIAMDAGLTALEALLAGPATTAVVLGEEWRDARVRWAQLDDRQDELLEVPISARLPRPDLLTPFSAPRTDTEQRIAAAWCACLGLDEVGTDDAFFDLGGSSLLGVAVIRRLEKEFDVALSPGLIFEKPTVAELARTLERPLLADVVDDGDEARSRRRPTAAAGRRRALHSAKQAILD
ncbi:MAG TPA: SDR family NAD(P)-dependent oxidoreductase [Acidimicrobiales bacterium]|nr:SDR family NAD(P)-dependent oxidoreductase [Acidimicrobiales bacterium]